MKLVVAPPYIRGNPVVSGATVLASALQRQRATLLARLIGLRDVNRRAQMTSDRQGFIASNALISLGSDRLEGFIRAPIGGQSPTPIRTMASIGTIREVFDLKYAN